MIKVILFGLGNIGSIQTDIKKISRTHLSEIIKNKFKILALVEKNQKKINVCRKNYNLPSKIFFKSINQLQSVKNICDICIIATNPKNRYRLIKIIKEKINPRMIILEKPMDENMREANKIYKYLKKNKIKSLIHYNREWDKKTNEFLDKIDVNKTRFINIVYSKGLINNASHYLYVLRNKFGKFNLRTLKVFDKNINKGFKNFSFYFKIGTIPIVFNGIKYHKYKVDLLEMEIHTNEIQYSLRSAGVQKIIMKSKSSVYYPNYKMYNHKSERKKISILNSFDPLYENASKILKNEKKFSLKNLIFTNEINLFIDKIIRTY